jgi:hypothetical protein
MMAAQYTERIPADEEEPELISTSDEESPKKWSSFKLGALGLGVAVLVVASAALVVNAMQGGSMSERAPANSARALLESPEMTKAFRDNYMKWNARKLLDEEKKGNTVEHGTKAILKVLQATSPKAYEQLNQLTLTAEQKDGVLKGVRNLGDDRLQTIGKEIAKIAKSSQLPGKRKFSANNVKRQLTASFKQNKSKLADLRNELVPLRALVDKNIELVLDADKMRLFRYSGDAWDAEQDMEQHSQRRLIDHSFSASDVADASTAASDGAELSDDDVADLTEKFGQGLGVFAGLLEQARVALDQIDFVGESFDVDMKIPYWAKSFVGGLDFVAEMSDCFLRDGLDGQGETDTNDVKLVMCPMKYASAAADFLECVDNVMGIDNTNLAGGSTIFGSDNAKPQPGAAQPASFQQQPGYVAGTHPGYVPAGAGTTFR